MSDTKLKSSNPPPAEATPADRKRILLVEGDGFTRLVLLLRLRLAGFAVDFTSNGVLGLGKLRSCHPDILLIDVKLNGLSGVDLLKAARAESGFGDRPIYVFTQVNRMNRATRKEVESLATKVFDKSSCTREDLVQIFAATFLKRPPAEQQRTANSETEAPAVPLSEVVPSGAIEELIAGVHEQSELFANDTQRRVPNAAELQSRVSSLASCAKAAGLSNLTRQAKALEKLLTQLTKVQQDYSAATLSAVTRAVEVMRGMSFEITGKKQTPARFSAVFIDEAPYSNRAVEQALLEAGFQPACFEDPVFAKEYLISNRTDLIIANVVLPEAHGLSLGDIRKLPLHTRTRVLFGPESAIMPTIHGDLPTSATRLDKAPLLLSELVVRALNEVQLPESQTSGQQASVPAASQAEPQTAANVAAVEALPPEDGFELFAAVPQRNTLAEADPTPPSVPVPVHAVNKPKAFDHLFTAANIPMEPIMRARPSAPDQDQEVQALEPLPENPVDGTVSEEPVVEALPLSALRMEAIEQPQPEATPEDLATQVEWIAPAADPADSSSITNDAASGFEHEVTPIQEQHEATSNNGEDMNNRIQPVSEYLSERADEGQIGQGTNERPTQREDLAARVCAAEMALYHAQAQIEQREKDFAALEKKLAEVNTGKNLNGDASAADNSADRARCAELEEEVAALRQAFEGLNGGFSEQQHGTAEATKQLQELEQRLAQNGAELEKAKEEQRRAEAELRQQLEAAGTARQEADARSAKLEEELESLRKAQAEIQAQKAQQKSAQPKPADAPSLSAEAWPGASANELEQQVRQGVAALAKATAELAKERGERQRSQQRVAELNGRLQALHDDLSRTLHAQRDDLARLSALEEQHRQATQSLERGAADLEQHQAERRLVEEQLQKAKESNLQMRKDLAFYEEANKKFGGTRQELQNRLEASLSAARESEARLQQEAAERQRLTASLEEARRELQTQSRKRETLEQELQNDQNALKERDAKLAEEAAERQRLTEQLDSLHRGFQNGSERDLEFSKVQSALQLEQVERKRQETQLARTRQRALDAAHSARALRTSLRRQIREPVDNLAQSARSLLEMEMSDAQKQLAEAVLQDVLLVQTRLRDPGLSHGDSSDTTHIPATPAT
jgi:DNA-binding response OmpR family regulator